MKTVFITSFHGLVSRVLEAGIIDLLKKAGVRIILFVSADKADYFKKVFSGPAVSIEPIDYRPTLWEKRFNNLALLFLPTRTMRVKWRCDIRNRLGYFLNSIVPRFLPPAFLGFILQRLENVFVHPELDLYFKKYNPDLVFSTDLQINSDIAFLKVARQMGVKTVGMIRSWDNPTAKGLLRFVPDKIIAVNEVVKEEVVQYNGVAAGKIAVTGFPPYDAYVNRPRRNRVDFFKELGADPNKKLIFFAPAGDRYIDTDWQLFEILRSAPQILVRFPPGDTVTLKNFQRPPNMFFYQPGVGFGKGGFKSREMTYEDVFSLADQLYYSDVIITGPSTIIVDAAAFDKPIIFYAIDGEEKDRPYCQSLRRYYDYDHLKKIIQTGGVRLARNRQELLAGINKYIADPSLDAEGRRRIREEQCWRLDGKSSSRLANCILSLL